MLTEINAAVVEPSDTEVVEVVKLWAEAAGVLASHADDRSPWALCDDLNTYAGFSGRDDRFHVWDARTVAVKDSQEIDIDTMLVWALAVISGRIVDVGNVREAATLVLDALPRNVTTSTIEALCVWADDWEAKGDPLGPAVKHWLATQRPGPRVEHFGWRAAAVAGVRAAWEQLRVADRRR